MPNRHERRPTPTRNGPARLALQAVMRPKAARRLLLGQKIPNFDSLVELNPEWRRTPSVDLVCGRSERPKPLKLNADVFDGKAPLRALRLEHSIVAPKSEQSLDYPRPVQKFAPKYS